MDSTQSLPRISTPPSVKPEPSTLHPPARQIFMFTEDQVQRQLTDMREQTAFMKTFRSALSSAVQEIKTLRTALSIENAKNNEIVNMAKKNLFDESTKVNKSLVSTFGPNQTSQSTHREGRSAGQCCAENSVGGNTVAASGKKCICDGLKGAEFTLLKDYLEKIRDLDLESKNLESSIPQNVVPMKPPKFDRQPHCKTRIPAVRVDILKQSYFAVNDSLSRLEALKPSISKKNATISKLKKELRFSDRIRIKREDKLEQKLTEVKEWKIQFENSLKANEKQLQLNRGLEVALDAERERVKACEKLLGNLDSTRRAFGALKRQASELMETLHRKDLEIYELQNKVVVGRRKEDPYLHIQDSVTSNIHGVSAPSGGENLPVDIKPNHEHCIECTLLRKECGVMREKYEDLRNEFETYREGNGEYEFSGHYRDNYGNQPHSYFPHRGRPRPPYSPHEDYYQRISRRPIRRQLEYDLTERQVPNVSQQPIHGAGIQDVATSMLSPIEESDEGGFNDVKRERTPAPVMVGEVPLAGNSRISINTEFEKQGCDVDCSYDGKHAPADMLERLHSNQSLKKFHGEKSDHGESPISHRQGDQHNKPSRTFSEGHATVSHTNKQFAVPDTTNSTKCLSPAKTGSNQFKLAKTSYLELGHSSSSSPCNSVSSSNDTHDAMLQEPHSHAFLNNYPDLTEEYQDDLSDKFSIHSSNSNISSLAEMDQKPKEIGVIWHPTDQYEASEHYQPIQDTIAEDSTHRHMINTSQEEEDKISVKPDAAKSKSKSSRYVTYKGHRIDITRFSIHVFRDIVWTLDGGPEAADDFIKFLASLAKKLNSNPKWAGKHALGKPKDWLELRGLY